MGEQARTKSTSRTPEISPTDWKRINTSVEMSFFRDEAKLNISPLTNLKRRSQSQRPNYFGLKDYIKDRDDHTLDLDS